MSLYIASLQLAITLSCYLRMPINTKPAGKRRSCILTSLHVASAKVHCACVVIHTSLLRCGYIKPCGFPNFPFGTPNTKQGGGSLQSDRLASQQQPLSMTDCRVSVALCMHGAPQANASFCPALLLSSPSPGPKVKSMYDSNQVSPRQYVLSKSADLNMGARLSTSILDLSSSL